MGKLIDLTGQRFGRLTVVKKVNPDDVWYIGSDTSALWLCKCDCGNEVVVLSRCLRRGNTKSCGCYRREWFSKIGRRGGNK